MFIVKIISTGATRKCETKSKANKLAKQLMDDLGLSVSVTEDRPAEGKVYSLTGGMGQPSIANGNTWEESVVRCKQCGSDEDSLVAHTKHQICGKCTRRNHNKTVGM